jgi:hypothetical protein
MKHNFKKMSDEELVALQETADEQTLAAIEAELESRATAAAEQTPAGGAPAEGTVATEEATAEEAKAAELEALLAKCQENVGHRCKLVPVGTIEWEEGTIVGCVKIKRSNTVAYAVKLDNGKRVVKNYKAPLFEILDEVVERAKVTRHAGSRAKAEPWSEERMAEEVATYIRNVGRAIVIKGATEEENTTGQITGIVPVKRSNLVLYRVAIPAPTEEDPKAVAIVHKSVANTDAYDIMDATEESEAFNAKYMAHRKNLANRTPLTGAELILNLELKLEKAKETVKKAEERVASLEKAIVEKKAQLEAAPAETAPAETDAPVPSEEDML